MEFGEMKCDRPKCDAKSCGNRWVNPPDAPWTYTQMQLVNRSYPAALGECHVKTPYTRNARPITRKV